jgi:hypothetical protein
MGLNEITFLVDPRRWNAWMETVHVTESARESCVTQKDW